MKRLFGLVFLGVFLLSFFVSADVLNVNSDYTNERDIVVDAANRIIDLQYTDGSWDWVVTNQAGPTGTTYRNIAGVTAEILIDAYKLTGDSKYLDAAKDAGDYLLGFSVSDSNRYNAFNILFLYHLADISSDNQYSNHADDILDHVLHEENYWTNHNGNNCGTDGCTPSELLEALKNYRSGFGDPSGIVVWDLYNFIEVAQIGGESSFADDMADELDTYMSQAGFDDTIDYYVLGLSAGIMGLGNAGLDYSSYLTDLLSEQDPDGSWDGWIQDTAYALMALEYAGETDEAADAMDYLIDNFGYSTYDGWLDDGDEYSEVTSEATQAIFDFIYVPDIYYEIQDAVNSASNGDTISVSDGTYNPFTVSGRNGLTIEAASTPIVQGVQSVTTNYGDRDVVIFVEDSEDIVLDGLDVEGIGLGTINTKNYGIIYEESSGEIKDCIISPNTVGDMSSTGIGIWDGSEVIIDPTLIHNFGRIGVLVYNGADVEIYDSEIIGQTYAGVDEVNYGIEVEGAYGDDSSSTTSTAIIKRNKIHGSDNTYPTGPTWESGGIYINGWLAYDLEADSIVEVEENEIYDNYNGIIVIKSSSSYAHFNKIYNNRVYGVESVAAHDASTVIFDAENNWWDDCKGPYHPATNPLATGNEVSDDVDYDPWLGICIEDKADVTCAYELSDVTISANLSSLFGIDSVQFIVDIDGVINYYDYDSNIGDIYSYTIPQTELSAGDVVTWNVLAKDEFENEYTNGNMTFIVKSKTNLVVDPIGPDGLNDWYVTEPEFTLTNPDAGDIYYRWDSDPAGPLLYSTPFKLEDIPNQPIESAGILELNYWTDYGAGCVEPELTQIFYVDLTDPSITDLIPEDGSTVYNNLRPEISAYLDEIWQSNSGINKGSVIMEVDSILVTPNVDDADTIDATVSYTPDSDLSIGPHTVHIYVEDEAGRESDLEWSFSIDTTTAFNMVVESPENLVYGDRRIPMTITLDGEVELLEYKDNTDSRPKFRRLCRNCEGYDRLKSFKEGEHELVIRATDSFGYSKEEMISFEVDSKEPRISRIEPKRNSVTNGENFKVKYTEDNLEKVEVSVSDGVDTETFELLTCESGRNQECSIGLDLGTYNGETISYWFNVSDKVNNVQSRIYNVEVDTVDPILVVNTPENTDYGRRVPFDLEVTNEEVKIIEYQDNLGNWRRLCTRCDEYDRSKSFRRGSHTVNIRAIDYAGNFDEETITFNVDY